MPTALIARGWPRRLEPTEPGLLEPIAPGAVSLAVLPDTQYYASCNSPHFRAQSEWIAAHAVERNVAAVLHLGDLTEHNTPEEWAYVKQALSPVHETLPTFLATGNHDHGDGGSANRRWTLLSETFPRPAPRTAPTLAETRDPGDLENAYYRLALARVTLGVLVLEWSPRRSTVDWANQVLSRHPKDRVIFVTHAYLYHDSTRYDWASKGPAQEWNPNAYGTSGTDPNAVGAARRASDEALDGERLWRELVSRHAGVFLTLNGHVLGDGAGVLSSTGDAGQQVHQVLVNYQMLEQGGLGYLRMIELSPDGSRLSMKTFSPSLSHQATGADQRFELSIVPPLWQ